MNEDKFNISNENQYHKDLIEEKINQVEYQVLMKLEKLEKNNLEFEEIRKEEKKLLERIKRIIF